MSPLTEAGKKTLKSMVKEFGSKGKEVFYASMEKGTIPKHKMEMHSMAKMSKKK
jgi:hypothetical protein